ncbi:MAG: hypothetical protein B7Z63_02135, partial [Ignavibacteriae bacterium 37-53-5]
MKPSKYRGVISQCRTRFEIRKTREEVLLRSRNWKDGSKTALTALIGCGFFHPFPIIPALLNPRPIFARMPVECHVVSPAKIVDSDFNTAFTGEARR